MRIAIHQPNFFPYYPFFQKMESVDRFIILGHCQFEKNNFQNRFDLNGWNTMAVNSGLEPINKKRYVNHQADWDKIKGKFNKLCEFDECITDSLFETNTKLIQKISKKLNINTEIVFDYETELKGTDRLIDLCRHYGGTEYVSGISGSKYLELNKFEDIKLSYQDKSTMLNKSIIELL